MINASSELSLQAGTPCGASRAAGGVDRLLLTTFLRPGETGDRDKGELSRVLLSSDVLHHRRRPIVLPTS